MYVWPGDLVHPAAPKGREDVGLKRRHPLSRVLGVLPSGPIFRMTLPCRVTKRRHAAARLATLGHGVQMVTQLTTGLICKLPGLGQRDPVDRAKPEVATTTIGLITVHPRFRTRWTHQKVEPAPVAVSTWLDGLLNLQHGQLLGFRSHSLASRCLWNGAGICIPSHISSHTR